MRVRYGMLSDDLTGSMDAGVRLLGAGLALGVCLDPSRVPELSGTMDLVVLDTESRNVAAPEAAGRVASAIAALRREGAGLLYKKIDSTLRGNLGAELDAVLASGCAGMVVVAPALPYNGRVTRHGVAYVKGVPLADTEFAADPFAPIPDSSVPALIGRQSSHTVSELGLEVVRGGGLHSGLRSLLRRGARIVVVDAETEADLAAIAGAAFGDAALLLCGSAGLFDRLRPLLSAAAQAREPAATGASAGLAAGVAPDARGAWGAWGAQAPIIVLSGSPSAVSKAQIRRAAGDKDTVVLQLEGRSAGGGGDADRVAVQAAQALRGGRNVVVDAAGAGKAEIAAAHAGDARGLLEESARVQGALAGLLTRVLEQVRPGGLVLFGGDTALTICHTLGVAGIRIIAEAEPFVAAGAAVGGAWDGLPLVTKAGGFGSEDVIASALALLRG